VHPAKREVRFKDEPSGAGRDPPSIVESLRQASLMVNYALPEPWVRRLPRRLEAFQQASFRGIAPAGTAFSPRAAPAGVQLDRRRRLSP